MELNVKCLLMFFLAVVTLSSCSKDDYNAEEQAKKDDALIVDFIAKNNIQATKHSSGLYYQIITDGTGASVTAASTVGVNYVGRFLNGSQFEKSEAIVTFPLSQVIQGWTIGVPLIKVGGRIRLIIPSGLAYGNRAQGSIAKNTVLDFTIDLIHGQ